MYHWVIQSNVCNEPEYPHIIDAVERLGCSYTLIEVVPFTHEFVPEVVGTPPFLPIGTTTLVHKAKSLGWTVFLNENFDSRKWREGWRSGELLNGLSITARLGDIEHVNHDELFIRPTIDNKVFTGRVVSQSEFPEWRKRLLDQDAEIGGIKITPDTLVTVSRVKDIYQEYRLFVVNGKVITGSLYKRNGKSVIDPGVDQDVWDYAQARVDEWQPDTAFVLDIARTPMGLKIIEVNCLNCAGFYACDMAKVVNALEETNPK